LDWVFVLETNRFEVVCQVCRDIVSERVKRTKTPLTVIHEGKALVIIYPATTQSARPTFGAMKGSGEILGDLIAPVAEQWEVLE
jgi:antitoxin VapB